MKQKKIILIPYYVQEIMQRNSLQLADCLDLVKIRRVISVQDIAGFIALQGYNKTIFGIDIIDDLSFTLSNSIIKGNTELNDFLWKTLTPLSIDESIQNELKARLFESSGKIDHYKEPFGIYDLTPEVGGVVIYPGYFTTNGNTELQKNVIEKVLKLLYVYGAFHEVASTPFFNQYLKLLKN